MDNLTPKERSAQMAKVRSKNTKPEMVVRRLTHGMGYRYRLHAKELPGKPDLVFRRRQKVIFVNGCFWHGHKCKLGRIPKSRIKFWTNKIEKNGVRDKENLKNLSEMGWSCLVVWECQIKDSDTLQNLIKSFLD